MRLCGQKYKYKYKNLDYHLLPSIHLYPRNSIATQLEIFCLFWHHVKAIEGLKFERELSSKTRQLQLYPQQDAQSPTPIAEQNLLSIETMDPTETSALPALPNEDLTPLEQDVLDEYERLAENMKKVLIPTTPQYTQPKLIMGFKIVSMPPRRNGQQTNSGNPRWIATAGKENKLGVYVVEG
jgi:hypothetical protein